MTLTWLAAGVLALGALLATMLEPVAPARLTAMNNVASRAAALQPAFRTRRSSPFARKLESLPTPSV